MLPAGAWFQISDSARAGGSDTADSAWTSCTSRSMPGRAGSGDANGRGGLFGSGGAIIICGNGLCVESTPMAPFMAVARSARRSIRAATSQ